MALLQLFEQLEIQKKPPKHRLPLLKLPRVVLLECIANLDVLEIIIFSLLSKRAKSIARFICWNPMDIRLKFQFLSHISLRFPNDPREPWFIFHKKEKESLEYSYFHEITNDPDVRHLLLKDNGNVIGDLKQMVEHICEVFRSPLWVFDIFEESLIEWIINLQPTIRYVFIEDGVITSIETLDRVLKNLKVTEHFYLGSTEIHDEEFEVTEPILSGFISIARSYWFTLPAILNGNNSIIRLYDSMLPHKDINTILKEWQRGLKLRNLEYLEIEHVMHRGIRDDDLEVLEDLNFTPNLENAGRPTKVQIHDERTYWLPHIPFVCDLVRDDGMIGSVSYNYRVFRFQVWRRQI
ncbi:unnamed protein product [Caenorhabditis nigoni]